MSKEKDLTKPEIIEKLTELGIVHDPLAPKATLAGLLPVDDTDSEDRAPQYDSHDGIDVGDPLQLRPVELPLVVKPSGGAAWENDQQAEYAKYLNAYAYKNPKKWLTKKNVLIARLVEIGKNPSLLTVYNGGGDGNIAFSDKRIAPTA